MMGCTGYVGKSLQGFVGLFPESLTMVEERS